jgi:uncharacterized membrane protein
MSDLVAVAYDDLDTAERMATSLGDAVKNGDIELDDAVIVERRDDGAVKLHRPSLGGGLIGLVFFVPLLGRAIGGARGAAAAMSSGVDDDFLTRLTQELEPRKAALILLVRNVSADRILSKITEPGTVIQTSLSSEDEQALQQALDAARG